MKRIAVIPPYAALNIPRRIIVVDVDPHAKGCAYGGYMLELRGMGYGYDRRFVFVDRFDSEMQNEADRAAVRAAADELEEREHRCACLNVGAWIAGMRL